MLSSVLQIPKIPRKPKPGYLRKQDDVAEHGYNSQNKPMVETMLNTEKGSVSDHPPQSFTGTFPYPSSMEQSHSVPGSPEPFCPWGFSTASRNYKISLNHGGLEFQDVGRPWTPRRQGFTRCKEQKDFARAWWQEISQVARAYKVIPEPPCGIQGENKVNCGHYTSCLWLMRA